MCEKETTSSQPANMVRLLTYDSERQFCGYLLVLSDNSVVVQIMVSRGFSYSRLPYKREEDGKDCHKGASCHTRVLSDIHMRLQY